MGPTVLQPAVLQGQEQSADARDYERVFLFGGSWQARARSLWHVRLLPMLRQQEWLQELRASLVARHAAGEGSS